MCCQLFKQNLHVQGIHVMGPIYKQLNHAQCILCTDIAVCIDAKFADCSLELDFVGAHQRESGILTGAGGSRLQLEPSWSPESGILPEPAARDGSGNRVSVPELTLAGTRFFKRVELRFQFSIWNRVEPGNRRNRPSLIYTACM